MINDNSNDSFGRKQNFAIISVLLFCNGTVVSRIALGTSGIQNKTIAEVEGAGRRRVRSGLGSRNCLVPGTKTPAGTL